MDTTTDTCNHSIKRVRWGSRYACLFARNWADTYSSDCRNRNTRRIPFVTNRSAPLSATGKMCGGNINLSQAVIPPYRPILPPVVAPPAISPSGANDLSPSIPNVPIVPIPPLNPPGGGDGDLCKGLSPEQRNQIPICKEDRP